MADIDEEQYLALYRSVEKQVRQRVTCIPPLYFFYTSSMPPLDPPLYSLYTSSVPPLCPLHTPSILPLQLYTLPTPSTGPPA